MNKNQLLQASIYELEQYWQEDDELELIIYEARKRRQRLKQIIDYKLPELIRLAGGKNET